LTPASAARDRVSETDTGSGLVDRDAELAVLDELLRLLADEAAGGVCLVTGPAGIGKSSLVAAALDRAAAYDVTIAWARAFELEGGLSFGVARDLLGALVHRLSPADQEVVLAGPARFARPVLGLATPDDSGDSGDSGDGDPLYDLYWLVVALAEQRPLVLALDDLQWLDAESARFVAYLGRRIEGLPILLLATVRTGEPGPGAFLEDELGEQAQVVRPVALSLEGVATLVPGAPPDRVLHLTGGNPLLAVELARALADADPGTALESVAPRRIGAGILRLVAQISPAAVSLSRAVALSPTPLTVGDAGAIADLDDEAVVTAADALVRAEVLVWDGERLSFRHPLMRTAVYDELDPVHRRLAHTKAAAALAARGANVEVVATHVLAGEPQGKDDNVRILVAAADEAVGRLAHDAAARYLARAIVEPPSAAQELNRLQYRLGRLQLHLRRDDAVGTLAAALASAGDGRAERISIALDLADAHFDANDPASAATLIEPYVVADPSSDLDLDAVSTALVALFEMGVPTPDPGIPATLPGDSPAQRRALCVLSYVWLADERPAVDVRPLVVRSLGDLGNRRIYSEMRAFMLGQMDLFEERERSVEGTWHLRDGPATKRATRKPSTSVRSPRTSAGCCATLRRPCDWRSSRQAFRRSPDSGSRGGW
jgi:hypothetical protein